MGNSRGFIPTFWEETLSKKGVFIPTFWENTYFSHKMMEE